MPSTIPRCSWSESSSAQHVSDTPKSKPNSSSSSSSGWTTSTGERLEDFLSHVFSYPTTQWIRLSELTAHTHVTESAAAWRSMGVCGGGPHATNRVTEMNTPCCLGTGTAESNAVGSQRQPSCVSLSDPSHSGSLSLSSELVNCEGCIVAEQASGSNARTTGSEHSPSHPRLMNLNASARRIARKRRVKRQTTSDTATLTSSSTSTITQTVTATETTSEAETASATTTSSPIGISVLISVSIGLPSLPGDGSSSGTGTTSHTSTETETSTTTSETTTSTGPSSTSETDTPSTSESSTTTTITTTSPPPTTTTTSSPTTTSSSTTTTTTTSPPPTTTTTSSSPTTTNTTPPPTSTESSSTSSTSSTRSESSSSSETSSSSSSISSSSLSSLPPSSSSSIPSSSPLSTSSSTTLSSSSISSSSSSSWTSSFSPTSLSISSTSSSTESLTSSSTSTSFTTLTSTSTVIPSTTPDPPPPSTVFSTTTFFTDASSTVTKTTSSGVLNTDGPGSGSAFARNQGAIIGVAVGGVMAVILAVIAMFFLCRKWRRRNGAPLLGDRTVQRVLGTGPGTLGRDGSQGPSNSSRRMLTRNYSSTETGTWRPPLSDEDVEDVAPPPLPQSPSGLLAVGGTGVGVLASQGHSTSSSNSQEDLGGNASVSGHGHSSTYSHSHYGSTIDVARKPSVARQNSNHMPGFGQAAEHMAVVDYPAMPSTTPTSPLFSIGPTASPIIPMSSKITSPPSAYMMQPQTLTSSSSHDHSSSDGHGTIATGTGGGPPLQHTSTIMSTSSSSGVSHSHSMALSNTSHPPPPVPLPRVRIHESSPRNSVSARTDKRIQGRDSTTSFKGLISRLRGGARTSSQDMSVSSPISGSTFGRRDTLTTTTASSSFHYPPSSIAAAAPSSLLNPPLPPSMTLPRPEEPWAPHQQPLPSPVPTEESSVRITEGLLDPHLIASTRSGEGEGEVEASSARMLNELGATPSVSSLRDNIDYSRPYRGFVFNRLGSQTTFATTDGRTPALETPASLGVELPIDEANEVEYFGIAR